ncbi:MAG: NTP transferase domain-containing protein [Patescibacteria group bacterium]|nr:NTP transferase domain-containing protein [Patescibacteria group bacterium]
MSTRIIILAAGKGKRMGADVPKPLVEIGGRPMVRHLLDSIEESGIDERPILVVAPDSLEHFYDVCSDKDCDYAIQEEQLGTGHAVQAAKEKAETSEQIIVLNGDHPFITSETIKKLTKLYKEHNPAIAMMTIKVPNFKGEYETFVGWGRVIRDEVGNLVEIKETKDATDEEKEIKELNPQIFMFNAEWLWDHLPELKNKNASSEYYITDLVSMAIDEGSDVVTDLAEPFEVIGINTKEELARAEKILA